MAKEVELTSGHISKSDILAEILIFLKLFFLKPYSRIFLSHDGGHYMMGDGKPEYEE